MKKESPVIQQMIDEMSSLTRNQRESRGKKAYNNLVGYFNILIDDKKISSQYVHAFSSIFIKADKDFDENELELFQKVLKIKYTKDEFLKYIDGLDKKGYIVKSLELISRSGQSFIKDALALGLTICFADGVLSKEEIDWFKAVSKKFSLIKE